MSTREDEDPKIDVLTVVGRLKRGTTLHQAQAEMEVIARLLGKKRPATNADRGVQLVSLHETVVGNVRLQLLILFGAVLLVVTTAGANVANLLLARGVGRRREMAVRTAIGASRSRLIRQMVTESVLLCLIGGILGFLLATLCENTVLGFAPQSLPRVNEISLDYRTFLFSLIVAVLIGGLCGIVPALRASGTDLPEALKAGAPFASNRGGVWLGNTLVTAQVALALMLLIATGLMIRTFAYLHAVPLGFDPQDVVYIRVNPPLRMFASPGGGLESATRYSEAILEQIKRIPEIQFVAMGALPLRGGANEEFQVEGRQVNLRLSTASSDYFRVLRVQLLAGQLFNENDSRDSPCVAIVNQTAASELWPGLNPIGRKFSRQDYGANPPKPEWIQVVGVVKDVKTSALEGRAEPYVYVPLEQSRYIFYPTVLLRSRTDPARLMPSLRKALNAVDKVAPLSEIVSMRQVVDKEFAGRMFNLLLISIFGALAFALATLGIYGINAYVVSTSTQEFGLRLALGPGRETYCDWSWAEAWRCWSSERRPVLREHLP